MFVNLVSDEMGLFILLNPVIDGKMEYDSISDNYKIMEIDMSLATMVIHTHKHTHTLCLIVH